MKTVIIKEIRLLNFKGLRDLTVEFDPALTEIYGRNGIGKTSIFDGFTWLLFGKNSEDRKQFGIKTYDEAGNIIPKLPHEVSAVLLVDGEVVTLCRRFNENGRRNAARRSRSSSGMRRNASTTTYPARSRSGTRRSPPSVPNRYSSSSPIPYTSRRSRQIRSGRCSSAWPEASPTRR